MLLRQLTNFNVMEKKLSIFKITPFFSPNIGGVETHLDDLVEYLDSNNISVTVLTYKPLTTKIKAAFKQKVADNAYVYRYPWFSLNLFYRLGKYYPLSFMYLFSGLFFYSFFHYLIRFKKFQIIHGHGLSAGAISVILASLFRNKAVISLHTVYKFSERKMLSKIAGWFLKRASKILVLSDGCKDDLVAAGIGSEKISIYTNWLDLKEFQPMPKERARAKLGLEKNVPVALFVGRLSQEKGVEVVLESATMLKKQIKMVVVGGGPLADKVKHYAKKHPHIINKGPVKASELPSYYSAADVLVMGPVDEDYLGRVSLSALACGCPILISNTSNYFGIKKKISFNFPEGVIGFKVNPKPKDLANELDNLMSDTKKLDDLSASCREYAEKNFSNSNGLVFIDVYNQLIKT